MDIAWSDLAVGLALALIIEGTLYTLFPDQMRKMMALALEQPAVSLRYAGLAIAFAGVVIVWLTRG